MIRATFDSASSAPCTEAPGLGAQLNREVERSRTAMIVYLCLVVPITILLNIAFVNFHAPDDYDHVKRAYTLLHDPLHMLTPAGRSTGAMIDRGLDQYIDGQTPIILHGVRHTANGRRAYEQNQHIGWTGTQTFSEMPGALAYFPLLYAPQALMLKFGELTGATVAHSVLWARIANGFTAIALAALGLYLLRGGQALALLMLLLPRTLLQFASNSADPILYGLALIIVAQGLRVAEGGRIRALGFAAAIFVSATVRPPIAALAFPGAMGVLRRRRWAAIALTVGACGAAVLWVATRTPLIVDHRCAALGSLAPRVETFAFDWPLLIGRTLSERSLYFYASFVGHYGWSDAMRGQIANPLPLWIYLSALPLLCFGLWQDLAARVAVDPIIRLSLAAGAVGSLLLTFFAMYVACTGASQPIIVGIQGRYFVPAVFALAPALAGLARGRTSWPRVYHGLLAIWVIACTTTMIADAFRFYPHFW